MGSYLGGKKIIHNFKKVRIFSKLKIQAVMCCIWLWKKYECELQSCENSRSVGPWPAVRREIREITVKEYLVLWSPF